MVRNNDNVDDVGEVALLKAMEDFIHHGIDLVDRFVDFRAVGAVGVSIAVDVGDIHGDKLGSRILGLDVLVFPSWQVEEFKESIHLLPKGFLAVVFIQKTWLSVHDMGLASGPHVNSRSHALLLRGDPERLAHPPLGVEAAGRVGVEEVSVEGGVEEGVADDAVTLRVEASCKGIVILRSRNDGGLAN